MLICNIVLKRGCLYTKIEFTNLINTTAPCFTLYLIYWLPQIVKFRTKLCVQIRLVCSAGDSPVRVKARSPVAWIAGRRVTKSLKPIDKVTLKGDEQVTRP